MQALIVVLLTSGAALAADNETNSTIDLLDDWPRRWIDPMRDDAARRPAYQRTPECLSDRPFAGAVRPAMVGDGRLQSYDTIPRDSQAMLQPVANLVLPVGPPEPWWIDAEFLYWWIKEMNNTPPLVTTGDSVGLGRIGQPSTTVLFPTGSLFQGPGSGGRIRFGHWCNAQHTEGIDGDIWGLNGPGERFSIASGGNPLIARPFFDTAPGIEGQNAEIVATDSVNPLRSGGVTIDANSDLYSAGVVWRWQLGVLRPCRARPCRTVPVSFGFLPRGDIRLDFTCGYRYARLQERLSISENVTDTTTNDRFDVDDDFRTTNDFNGAEIGLHYTHHHCRWFFELRPRIAFGNVQQRTKILGNTRFTPTAGATVNQAGGLLALAGTNIGTFDRDQFSMLSQVDTRLGYRLTDRWAFTVGYSFLYWMRVARPGEQIDFNVNTNYFPNENPFDPPPSTRTGPRDPTPLYADATFWAQGLNLGLEYRF